MRSVLLVLVMVAVVDVERAEACQCLAANPIVFPADGATNVPTNAMVVQRGGAGVELVSDTGEIVELDTTELTRDYSALRPRTPLAPNTTYELSAYTDQSRVVRFTTGGGTDDAPPLAAVLRSISPEVMDYPGSDGCVSACIVKSATQNGHISRITFDHDLAGDAAFAMVELRRQTETEVTRVPFAGYLGFALCEPLSPVLDPETAYCARIITYDAAGNTSASDEVCSTTARCESEVS